MNEPEARWRCEHHYTWRHQSDFPHPIYWVGVCTFCQHLAFDPGDPLAELIADAHAETHREPS